MKKIFCILLLLLLVMPVAYAKDKKPKQDKIASTTTNVVKESIAPAVDYKAKCDSLQQAYNELWYSIEDLNSAVMGAVDNIYACAADTTAIADYDVKHAKLVLEQFDGLAQITKYYIPFDSEEVLALSNQIKQRIADVEQTQKAVAFLATPRVTKEQGEAVRKIITDLKNTKRLSDRDVEQADFYFSAIAKDVNRRGAVKICIDELLQYGVLATNKNATDAYNNVIAPLLEKFKRTDGTIEPHFVILCEVLNPLIDVTKNFGKSQYRKNVTDAGTFKKWLTDLKAKL